VASLDAGLSRVDKAQCSVSRCMVVPGPELGGWEEVEPCGIEEDAFRDDLLQELSTALKE